MDILKPFRRQAVADSTRPRASISTIPFWDMADGFPIFTTSLAGDRLRVADDYLGLVEGTFKRNPIIFAAVVARMHLFSEARFQFRDRAANGGRPGKLFGSAELAPLETPWRNGTTGDLLSIGEVMVSCGGNAFTTRIGDRLKPLRPDFMTMIIDTPEGDRMGPWSPDAEVLGYAYNPIGSGEPRFFLPEEMAHYAPIPDPAAPWRGMSWITPVIEEVLADRQMTAHKRKYLEVGGAPAFAVKFPAENLEKFDEWVDKFEDRREGKHGNPYRTLFLTSAADLVPLGSNLQEIDFANVLAGGETRIAAAARVHPALLALSDALKGSALNAGNLKEVRRIFASMTMRPLWRNYAGSIATLINVPPAAELWYDDRDIPALQEDESERAEALQTQAATIWTLVQAGYEPDAAVDAVTGGDLSGLKGNHSGLTSVQLQQPGSSPPPATNGLARRTARNGSTPDPQED